MKRARFLPYCCIALVVLLISGCGAFPPIKFTPQPAVQPQDTPAQPPAATPAPDYALLAKTAEQAFIDHFTIDLGSLPPFEGPAFMADCMAQANEYQRIRSLYYGAAKKAYAAACADIGFAADGSCCDVCWVDWQLLFCLYRSYGAQGFEALLKKAMLVTFTVCEYGAVARVDLPQIYPLLEAGGAMDNKAFSAVLSYAYCRTFYDEYGVEWEDMPYMYPEGYLAQLNDPLPGKHIKNGWKKPRDGGKRYHTGTDIRAGEGTPILSCTDGVVQFNGTNEGAGNYIVILDSLGFAYHYYHMVQPTGFLSVGDTVKAGDVIGYVGNTGSSSANHLHLSVLSPEMLTIDPYTMLKEVRRLQKDT